MSRPNRHHLRRRGAELIEMAVAMNVLLFLSMGMVEFGQYFYIKHCFEGAVRDGGRCGILSGATQAQVVSTITTSLQQANVTYAPSWLTIYDLTTGTAVSDVSQVMFGDQLQFTLATTYGSVPSAVRPLYSITGHGIGPGKTLTATCIMVKE